jgi:RNA polymerase sigma factor for flagellar operon FliA
MPVALEGRAVRRVATKLKSEEPDIDELWRQYKIEGGEILRTRLIVHYMRTHVRRLAERLHSSLPQQVELDDLIQQGYLGLADAIERFDLQRDVRFETFSARRIFGSMRDYLRALDPMPRLARARAKQLVAAREQHQKQHGSLPSDQELREQLRLSMEQFMRLMVDGEMPSVVSYQAVNPDIDPTDDGDAMESLSDRGIDSPLATVQTEDLKRWVTRGLSRRDHLIIILYYYEQLTMREVGRALGISESRVSQRLESIIARLRARMCYQGAREEFV